jgi:hypothetical protein
MESADPPRNPPNPPNPPVPAIFASRRTGGSRRETLHRPSVDLRRDLDLYRTSRASRPTEEREPTSHKQVAPIIILSSHLDSTMTQKTRPPTTPLVQLGARVHPETRRVLRLVAASTGRKSQAILEDAVWRLAADYGFKKPLPNDPESGSLQQRPRSEAGVPSRPLALTRKSSGSSNEKTQRVTARRVFETTWTT